MHIGSADKGLGTDADIFRRERWLCSAHVSAIRDAHWRDPVVSVNTTDTVSTLLNVCRRGQGCSWGCLHAHPGCSVAEVGSSWTYCFAHIQSVHSVPQCSVWSVLCPSGLSRLPQVRAHGVVTAPLAVPYKRGRGLVSHRHCLHCYQAVRQRIQQGVAPQRCARTLCVTTVHNHSRRRRRRNNRVACPHAIQARQPTAHRSPGWSTITSGQPIPRVTAVVVAGIHWW